MFQFLYPIIIIVSLVIGFGMNLFFYKETVETAQDTIDNIVESVTGCDLDEIFKLDDELRK